MVCVQEEQWEEEFLYSRGLYEIGVENVSCNNHTLNSARSRFAVVLWQRVASWWNSPIWRSSTVHCRLWNDMCVGIAGPLNGCDNLFGALEGDQELCWVDPLIWDFVITQGFGNII